MNRTDTKFVTTFPKLLQLLALVDGEYMIQEVNGQRLAPYATTYWDEAEDMGMFRRHLCGHTPRMKVRVRTYVDSQETFLEVKRKDNHGKTAKTRVQVTSAAEVAHDVRGREFLEKSSGYTFDHIVPTLSNRFNRITLVNNARTERLTIDMDLRFHNCLTGSDAALDNLVIIELKRDGRAASTIQPLLRRLRVKPSGFSKYCIGTAMTNDEIRKNRFKPKLRKFRKLSATVEAPMA